MSKTRWNSGPGGLFAALAIVLLACVSAAAEPERFAVCRSASGPAEFSPDTDEIALPLRAGARIPSGSLVRVSAGAVAVLVLPDSHEVRLGPEATAVRWSGGRMNSQSIVVHHGQTSHSVNRLAERASYRVVAPVHVAGVRGTRFTVDVAENGAARTRVSEGEVKTGKDEPETPVGAGEEDEGYLVAPSAVAGDADWFEARRVGSAEEASQIESEASSSMESTRALSADDYREMASLTSRMLKFTSRPPRGLDDAAEIAEVLESALRVWQRAETRRESMEARRALTRRLAAAHGVSDEASAGQYGAYASDRASRAESIGRFADTMERLSSVLGAARAVNQSPAGGLLRRLPLPW